MAFCEKKVGALKNTIGLEEHLLALRFESLLSLYRICIEDSLLHKRAALSNTNIPDIVANEIIRRFLIRLPRKENIKGLEYFLQSYFPNDPLLKNIGSIYECLEGKTNWFEEERAFLSEIDGIASTPTKFSSSIHTD
jgi:hypothetical protein